jgi:hypothetical protein
MLEPSVPFSLPKQYLSEKAGRRIWTCSDSSKQRPCQNAVLGVPTVGKNKQGWRVKQENLARAGLITQL